MTEYLSKDALLAGGGSGLAERDVDLPGGGRVRIRALSRLEAHVVSEAPDTAEKERRILAAGMVNPAMSRAEAGQWQKSAAGGGDIDAVAMAIAELSGMTDDAPREVNKSVRGRRRS